MPTSRRSFLQHVGQGAALLALGDISLRDLRGAPAGGLPLPRSLPEAQGVSSARLLEFVQAVEARRLNLHSLMVVRRGEVVAEGWWAPYAHHLRHTLYSLSKSFTSTGVGLAAAEGKLSLDDTVVSFFPDELPAMVGPHLAEMRVKHLLMMGTGHRDDSLFAGGFTGQEADWIRPVLSRPVEFAPGTHFKYNNGASFLLSAIVQRATGETLLDYLTPRLLRPLGIEGADWDQNPQGICKGGWGLRVRTEDIAKLGQLYLQRGVWKGARILTEEWVAEATGEQIENSPASDEKARASSDWAQGYGYQFWRCRHGAVRGDGAYGQFCVMLPDREAVVAITAETNDLQGVLNAVWDHLLPALTADKLPADPEGSLKLREKLASLTLPVPEGQTTSPTAGRIHKRVFSIGENSLGVTRVTLSLTDEVCSFTLHDGSGDHRVDCGMRAWRTGSTKLSPAALHLAVSSIPAPTPIAGAAAWSDDHTLVMHWRFIETAHYQSVTCRFTGDDVRIEFRKSAAILNPQLKDDRPVLEGK